MTTFLRKKPTMIALSAAIMLAGCGATGGSDNGTGAPSTVTSILQNVAGGGDTNNNGKLDDHEFPNNGAEKIHSTGLNGFICDQGLRADSGTTTTIGANGLVGGGLNSLLNQLGGSGLSKLLAGISMKDDAVDADLETYAGATLLVDLLKLVSTLDLAVELPQGKVIPAGNHAVFAISMPPSLLTLSLGLNIKVQTYLNNVATGESITTDISRLGLLGLGGTQYGFVGFKTTKPYDRAMVSVGAGLLTLDLAKDSVRIHELCVVGHQAS